LLFRNAADVFFCFDGDRAGRGAAWKALESVLPRMKDGRQAFFLFLPEGEDPDTIVRKEGADGFDARLRSATPLSNSSGRNMAADVNLSNLDGKARLAERCKPLLAQIPDGAFGDLMKQRLTELTGIGARASTPDTHVPRAARAIGPREPDAQAQPRAQRHRAAAAATVDRTRTRTALIASPHCASRAWSCSPNSSRSCASAPTSAPAACWNISANAKKAAALHKLATQSLPGSDAMWQAEFLDTMAQLEKQTVQQRIDELQEKQREGALDDRDKDELRGLLLTRA
jgi:DNA primase